MSEPRTEAGREMHSYRHFYSACVQNGTGCSLIDAILAIEEEAGALGARAIALLRSGAHRDIEARAWNFRDWQDEAQAFVDSLP